LRGRALKYREVVMSDKIPEDVQEVANAFHRAWDDTGYSEVIMNDEKMGKHIAKNNLSGVSDEALQAELKRRKKKADRPPEMIALLTTPDQDCLARLNVLETACRDYVEQVMDEHPEPDGHWIKEAALKLFYGPSFYDWFNKVRE